MDPFQLNHFQLSYKFLRAQLNYVKISKTGRMVNEC